ncbi:hypothetical protein BDZ91DRAFT_13366 [Kalaharituber pfeilii]|nr:hypothetical protein BDZ91DRAFT_13366 [Kalaharituber pfeilii]
MPYLEPVRSNAAIIKTSDLTKQLRSRDSGESLLSLLDLAEELFYGTGSGQHGKLVKSIYFPRKEEWLVEWAVQRLREEEGDSGAEARLSSRFWRFLLDLLRKTDRALAAKCLRKHGFLQLMKMTLDECRNMDWVKRTIPRVSADSDMIMEDSSSTEVGSSPDEDTLRRKQARNKKLSGSLGELLGDMAVVVEYIQDSISGRTTSGVGIVPAMRGSPELGGEVLGRYLENIRLALALSEDDGNTKRAVSGIEAIVGIWKGCIYGNGDLKKCSSIFSKTCLLPLYNLLANNISDGPQATALERLVTDYIYTPAFIAGSTAEPPQKLKSKLDGVEHSAAQVTGDAMEKELNTLLAPLQGAGRSAGKGAEGLLKIGINKALTSAGKLTRAEMVERIFTSLVTVLLSVNLRGERSQHQPFPERDASIISTFLTIISQSGLSISDKMLQRTVDLAANLPPSRPGASENREPAGDVRWLIIEQALTLDFDTFVMSQSTSLLDRLVLALSSSWASMAGSKTATNPADVKNLQLRIVGLLLDGFKKARDLDGFLAFWSKELKSLFALGGDSRILSSIWAQEVVIASFSKTVESGYSSTKIDKVVKSYVNSLSESRSLADLVILDALLRGISREETEQRLKVSGTLSWAFTVVSDGVRSEAKHFTPWLGRQILFRLLQIDGELLKSEACAIHVVKDARAAISRIDIVESSTPAELGGILASIDILFHNVDQTGCNCSELSNAVAVVLDHGLTWLKKASTIAERWDGAILSLNHLNLPTAVLYVITSRWLRCME